jgi:hypothetical protein
VEGENGRMFIHVNAFLSNIYKQFVSHNFALIMLLKDVSRTMCSRDLVI